MVRTIIDFGEKKTTKKEFFSNDKNYFLKDYFQK